MQTQTVPRIQQPPRQASETSIHYGYVAYKDILNRQVEMRVQPGDSPYFLTLPAKQLIPFTNITVSQTDGTVSGQRHLDGRSATLVTQKTAADCAKAVEIRYQDWGFVTLHSLTGYTEDDAWAIFQTIQPFAYKLKDLVEELADPAEARIFADDYYTVEYLGETVDMRPLRGELRDVALQTRDEMLRSARQAQRLAEQTVDKTVRSLTSYFSGKGGKATPDPHDRYIFAELDREIPRLITPESEANKQENLLTKLAEAITGIRQQTETDELAEMKAKLAEFEQLKADLEALKSSGAPAQKPKKTKKSED